MLYQCETELNLPDWTVERVENSARDYKVHATYSREPSHCQTCGLAHLYRHGTRQQVLADQMVAFNLFPPTIPLSTSD